MATVETGARDDVEVKALKESTVCGAFQVTASEFPVSDAKNSIIVTEQAFLPIVMKVKEACGSVEHVISVDGGDGTMALDELEQQASGDFDFEAAWKAVEPDDVLT